MEELLQSMKLSDSTLSELSQAMRREMDRGLSRATNDEAEIKMLPTYVTGTPDGSGEIELL